MANYYRITAYCEDKNFSAIFDSYGMFEKKWQFSSFVLQHGMRIIEVHDHSQIEEVNIEPLTVENTKQIALRSSALGKPQIAEHDGIKTIQVGEKSYMIK